MTDDTTRPTDLAPDEDAPDKEEHRYSLPAEGPVSSPVGYGPPAEAGSGPGTSTASGQGEATGQVHETSERDTGG
jgi:hypothetical protein